MSKIWLVLLFCLSLHGKDVVNWNYRHTFELKKDEIGTISIVKKEYKNQSELKGKFKFRWTLYQNKLLVVLADYEGHPTQHVLEKLYKRDSLTFNLLGDYEQRNQRVILKLQFRKFGKEKATMEALIYDPKKRIEVKFIDPVRNKR